MAFEEFTGELDAPEKGAAYVLFSGQLDAPSKPFASGNPPEAGAGRGFVNPDAKFRASQIAAMDEETDPSNPNYLPITGNAQRALQTDARGGMDAKRTKSQGRVLDADIPAATVASVVQDIGAGALQIIPTVAKGIGDVTRMATGNRFGKGLSDYAESSMDAARNIVGSDRAAAQKKRFEQDMQDKALNPADLIVGNPGALFDQILPTVGSMALPIGAAAAAGGLARAGNAARLAAAIDPATVAARAATASEAAVIATTAAQNAADTYSNIIDKGGSQTDAYRGAVIAGGAAALVGKATGGGAEGALARVVGGKSVAKGLIEAPKAMAKEGVQEVGEQIGQSFGELAGNGEMFDANKFGKELAVAGTLGAVVGGGVNATSQLSSSVSDRLTAREKLVPADPIGDITKAQTADEAIAAATRATQSSAAVDNIAQILAQNQRPGLINSTPAATQSIALNPDIAALTQAITELENANVSTDPAIQPVPAVPDGRGGNQPAPGVDAGVGTGAVAGPAVDAGRILNSATGDSVPLGAATQLDAVGANNVQNTPPASTAQAQTPPGQAPEAGAIEPARQPAAGVQAGNADVQAAGVAPVAQEARTDAEIDAKTDEVMAVVNEMGGGPSRELTRRMIVEKGFIVADKSIESLKAEVAKRENKLAKYEAAKEKLNQVRGSLIPDPRLTPVSQRTKPLKTEPNQPPAQQNQAPAAIENVAPDPAKNLADARTGLAELESKRKLTRSNKRADIDGQIARLKDTIYEMETAMDTTPAAEIRLGRDNQPIHRGGKPFKTSDAAKEAKALQPMMRVVRVEGGFALADKTPAQLAAEQASSRRLRNPKTSPAGEPIPAHAFIAAEGGLHADTRADMNLGDNPRIGNRTLFSGASRIGLSIEQATERLIEEGYLPEDANQNQAMALIKRSLSNPQYTPDGVERMAEKEAEQRRKDYDAEQEEIAKAQELEDNQLADLADAYEAAMLDYPQGVAQSDMDMADAMRAADFTEQEIENATTNRSQSETGTGQSPGGSDAPATGARMQGAGRREGAPGENSRSGSEDSQGLTAPTQQEVLDQQDRKGNADKLDDREQIRKESEAGANQFSLTQEEGRQDTTGGLFDAPVPAAPKPDSRPIKAGDVLLGKDGLEYTVVDVYGNTVDAERVVEQDRGNKIIKGISLTAIDAVDARDRLNKQKAQTPDPLAETKATLDAANVTGKERLDVLKDVKAGTLTPSEVKDAYPSKIGDKGMAMFSRPTNAPGPEQNALQALSQADVSDPQTGVSTALLYLGQDDSLYQLPRSSAKDMQAIAADKGVQFNIEAESVTQPDGTERPNGIFNLTMPSGAKASIIVNGGDVYINVSGLKEGDRGNAVYDVAANYAVNNDLVFKGDPSGLSDAAMRRRLENMLSSAIKYGTTDHLEPHPKQLQGDASIGVPALKWTPGDTLGNIRAMVDASIEANDYSNPFGATLEYDPSSQRFKDPASGRNLGDQEVEAFSRLDDRNAGAGTAGRTTLQRTALFKSLVQSEGARRAFLESIRRQRSQRGTGVGAAGSALAGAFYSRSADPVAAAQSTQAVEKIVQGITSRWTNTPEVIVVSDMQDPRIPEKVRAQDLEQRSGGATGEPEGFYLGGKVYIVASQVSNPKDVARVLFHESLGHFGLRGVFGDQLKPILRQLSVLRRADVAAKAKQYGLDMGIESQRLQAAEEVLAEIAQTRPELGFVKSAVAAIRTWLRQNVPGFEKMALSDADIIQQFIIPARGFVERGAKAQMRGAVPAFSREAEQTETLAFKKWFGDSKVVDADGKPLVVYHGTAADFDFFDNSKTGRNDRGLWGKGHYFSAVVDGPNSYALRQGDGARVIPAYVSIKHPLVLKTGSDLVTRLPDGTDMRKLVGPNLDGAKIKGIALAGGHDGVIQIRPNGSIGDVVAYNSNQIKSAIGNSGEFDGSNPDIRFSRSPIPTSAQQTIPPARQPLPANQALSPWRDGTGRMQFAPGQWMYNQLGRAAGPTLVRLGLKAATPELRRQLRQMKIDVEKAQEVAGAIAKETMILSEDERAMVSDLVEKELKAGVIPPAHAVRLAAMINDAMNQQTDELVNLGMLTKDSADRWRGQYLPRYYESKMREKGQDAWADALKRLTGRTSVMKGIKGKHLKGRGLYETIHEAELANYEALGWEVRDPDYNPSLPSVDGTVQVWRDFTRQERDGMGEIRDAGFRFVMGYMQTQRDIAVGRMFERMAQDPEQSSRLEKEGYVQVPTTTVSGTGAKVYGKLAGRWVPAETLSQLSNIEEGQSAAWQMYRKAMGIWKEGKTALNPVSHVNNMVSNLTMAHLAGVSYHRGDKYLSAARDFFKKSGMIQEAKDNGLFLGTMSDTELMNVLPDDLKLLVQKQESTTEKVARTGFDILTMFLRKPMGAAYQAEDTFFRYLIYKDAREQGMDPQDSVEYAQKFIFTYDDLPKGARRIRDFGVPFFSYTYKAVPVLLHTALTHPVRMAGPAAVLWGINAAAYAIAAGDDDDSWMQTLKKYLKDEGFREAAKKKEQLEREHLPSWMKGTTALLTPKTLRLGMDEVTKLPLFIDISRIIPGGDLFDVSPNAGGLPIPQPITPSHPLFTTAVAMLGNKDLFYGKELTDSNDTIGEASTKRAAWLWKQLTPAIAAGNYHWERGMNALAQANGGEIKYVPDMLGGDATGIGRDGLPVQPKYAAMQTFGVKVRPMDLDSAEAIDQSMKNKMIKDIDIELKKLQRLNNKGAIPDRVMENARELSQVKKERLRLGLTVDGGEKP